MALEVELDQVELRLAEDGPANPGEWIPKLVSLAAVVVVARAVHDLSGCTFVISAYRYRRPRYNCRLWF